MTPSAEHTYPTMMLGRGAALASTPIPAAAPPSKPGPDWFGWVKTNAAWVAKAIAVVVFVGGMLSSIVYYRLARDFDNRYVTRELFLSEIGHLKEFIAAQK